MATPKVDRIKELEALVAKLTADVEAAKAVAPTVVVVQKAGKKAEALSLLLKHPSLQTTKFASLMNINPKNVQSLVHYLRDDDGWYIPKGSPYSLQVNDKLVEYSLTHKLEQFMLDRIDEYNAIKAYRASKAQ